MVDRTQSDLTELANRSTYIGSGEHKRFPNPMCIPGLRTDASNCDEIDSEASKDLTRLNGWLREAIRRGQVDRIWEGEFPRKVWGWVIAGERPARHLVEARLTNQQLGHYKGYFIDLNDLLGRQAWTRRKLAEGAEWWEILR